jgi:hypothetical protein
VLEKKRGGSNGKKILLILNHYRDMIIVRSSCTVCVTDIFISICDAKMIKAMERQVSNGITCEFNI